MNANTKDYGVSPVVGVMLMLTVTLILAAIISGMTGGITQVQKKPPQLVIQPMIVSDGDKSFFDIAVVSVSEGIPTRDLKIITEWKNSTGNMTRTVITPGLYYPFGIGPGINADAGSFFGNYTILAGTRLHSNSTGLNKTLGNAWAELHDGDIVSVRIIDIPAGSTIAEKEITVEE